MSAKDQIKQIVDFFKKEPQLKDKTDGMAEGLLLGAQLADDANELSKETDASFKTLQREYTENGNGSQTTAEITVARDGELVLDDRLKRDFGNVNAQLAQTFNFATRIYLDLISRGVNALYPPEGYEACVGDGVTDDTVALKSLIEAFDVVLLPPKKYRTTEKIKIGGRWKALMGFVNIARDEKNAATIFYDGPINNKESVVIIGQNEVGAKPSIDSSGIVFQNIVVDANNKAGIGVYGTYLTNETTVTGIRAKNSLEYDFYFSKAWYATISDIVSLGCRGKGIALGMPLEYIDGTSANFTDDDLVMNNCTIERIRSIGSGKYYSVSNQNMYKPTNPTNRRKVYGVGIGYGNGMFVNTITSEQSGGPGLYVMTSFQPIKVISKVYIENNCLNSGLNPANEMVNMIIENTSTNGGEYRIENVFMNYGSGGIFHTGVKRRVKLVNVHQPRFLRSLDGLNPLEVWEFILKDNVYFEAGYHNTDEQSKLLNTRQKVDTRYSFSVELIPGIAPKALYIKAPLGGDGTFKVVNKDGTSVGYSYTVSTDFRFLTNIPADAVKIEKAAAGAADKTMNVEFLVYDYITTF